MYEEPLILSVQGGPFSDRDAAAEKARILTAQVGELYEVVGHPEGGFAVARAPAEAKGDERGAVAGDGRGGAGDVWTHGGVQYRHDNIPGPEMGRKDGGAASPRGSRTKTPSGATHKPLDLRMHPSWYSFVPLYLLVFAGIVIYVEPVVVWGWMVTSAQLYHSRFGPMLQEVIAIAGLALSGWAAYQVLLKWAAHRYRVTDHAVERTAGLWARTVEKIYIEHIRTADMRQSMLGRFLNYGTVELATAGTAGKDMIMADIDDPAGVLRLVQERMELQHKRDTGE